MRPSENCAKPQGKFVGARLEQSHRRQVLLGLRRDLRHTSHNETEGPADEGGGEVADRGIPGEGSRRLRLRDGPPEPALESASVREIAGVSAGSAESVTLPITKTGNAASIQSLERASSSSNAPAGV